MSEKFLLSAPFFEFGPKVYLYGRQAVDLAIFADALVDKYGVDILFTAQYTDIEPIAKATQHIRVMAQHMDYMDPGRGLGRVLPEAIKSAGAKGVMLNHTEFPLSLATLNKTIKRANALELGTVVCADTPEEGVAIAHLAPSVVLVEEPEMIDGGVRAGDDSKKIANLKRRIHAVNHEVLVMHGAGITDEKDVYNVIFNGSDGTGSTSGVINAQDPFKMLELMIEAVRAAWNDRQ